MKIVVGCYDGSLVGWSSSSDSSHQQQGSEIATKSAVQLEEENSEDDERGEQRKRKRGKVGVEAEESGSETVPRDEIEEMIESLELSFAYKAHKGCIKVIAINGSVRVEEPPGSKQEGQNVQKKSRSEASNGSVPKTKKKKKKPLYMAVGGADELVKIYSLSKKQEVGEIVEHTDTITALSFVGKKFLLSGSQDERLLLWRVSDWNEVHEYKGHKRGVVSGLSVHPTAKLFFSISRDNSLRLWDVGFGKAASRNRIEGYNEIQLAEWSPAGAKYVLVCDNVSLLVFDVANNAAKPEMERKCSSRINQILFATGDIILIGYESLLIEAYSIEKQCVVGSINCEITAEEESRSRKPRLRFMKALYIGDEILLVVGLTTNMLKFYRVSALDSEKVGLEATGKVLMIPSSSHITALAVVMEE